MNRLVSIPLVLLAISLVIALFARVVLLPIGLWLQRHFRLSDEFVTDLSIGLPLALFIISYAGWFTWVSQ